jgi:hypothetical protein
LRSFIVCTFCAEWLVVTWCNDNNETTHHNAQMEVPECLAPICQLIDYDHVQKTSLAWNGRYEAGRMTTP